jgi:hypothetical protein
MSRKFKYFNLVSHANRRKQLQNVREQKKVLRKTFGLKRPKVTEAGEKYTARSFVIFTLH